MAERIVHQCCGHDILKAVDNVAALMVAIL